MTLKELNRQFNMFHALQINGISAEDTKALRRISMTLRRWYEKECGNEYGNIERDEVTGKTYWFATRHGTTRKGERTLCDDKETGALRRLNKIMATHPHLTAYVQTDPRGPALYILRPGDVPDGKDDDAYYSHGIAVY